MIQIKNLSKKFRSHTVLNDITINFENKTYGLLGENGAGKTTLIRCITGMYSKYDGSIEISGAKNKNDMIGYLPQNFGAFKELTVNDMMLFMANQKGLGYKTASSDIASALELVNLSDKTKTKIGKLSGGMLRRFGIAQALLGDPETIIFDEPTTGLDPEERLRFKNIVEKIKKGKTIILSTHIVEDVDVLCDEIAIMKNGKIIECGDIEYIKSIAKGKVFEIPTSFVNTADKEYEIIKQFQRNGETCYRILSKDFDESFAVSPSIEDGYLCAIKGI